MDYGPTTYFLLLLLIKFFLGILNDCEKVIASVSVLPELWRFINLQCDHLESVLIPIYESFLFYWRNFDLPWPVCYSFNTLDEYHAAYFVNSLTFSLPRYHRGGGFVSAFIFKPPSDLLIEISYLGIISE